MCLDQLNYKPRHEIKQKVVVCKFWLGMVSVAVHSFEAPETSALDLFPLSGTFSHAEPQRTITRPARPPSAKLAQSRRRSRQRRAQRARVWSICSVCLPVQTTTPLRSQSDITVLTRSTFYTCYIKLLYYYRKKTEHRGKLIEK